MSTTNASENSSRKSRPTETPSQIDINTKFIMLIGTPLDQSFAARMQNTAYDAAGFNLRYFYNEADSAHLREIVDGVRHSPAFIGAAVTHPNKVEVLQYLDELDPLCAKMGSCNTIVKRADGTLIGYNTDGIGFYESFVEGVGFPAKGKTFFCIGAGGAGRAICSALAHNGAAAIMVADVLDENAALMVKDINVNFAPIATHIPHDDLSAAAECDCVINASGVGMGESIGASPLPTEHISSGQVHFDACYNPEKTRFLLNAEERGCTIMNGLDMSLYQGAAQIRLWTGQEPPIDVMRAELDAILAERKGR